MNYYCKDSNNNRKRNNQQRKDGRPKRFGDLRLMDNGCRDPKYSNNRMRMKRNNRHKRPSPSDALANPMACKNAFREIFKTACLSNYNYCRRIRAICRIMLGNETCNELYTASQINKAKAR